MEMLFPADIVNGMKHVISLLLGALLLLLASSCTKDKVVPDPWQPVSVRNNATPIRLMEEVRFSSAQVGWISGGRDQDLLGNPVLLKTTDGGNTWNSMDLSALRISRFIAFFPVNDQLLYACAPDLSLGPPTSPRVMYKSSDGGITWLKLFSTNFNGSYRLHFFTDQIGLSANISQMLRTTDGGETWRTVFEESLAGLDLLQGFASGTVYAAGGGGGYDGLLSTGILLKSTDRGQTWQKLPWPRPAIHTLSFLTEQIGFAGTLDRQLYKTVDGGSSWQRVAEPLPGGAGQGVFMSEQEGYLAGTALYHTTDGGRSWQVEHPLPATDVYTALGFSPAGTEIAVTRAGGIVRKE